LQNDGERYLKGLALSDSPPPRVMIDFVLVDGGSHQKGAIKVGSSLLYSDNSIQAHQKLCTTVDHEIAHYVQYVKNTKLRKVRTSLIPGLFCWIMKGVIRGRLAQQAFREGFATYVASKTSGSLNPKVEKVLKNLKGRKKWRMLFEARRLPYALGYQNFCAIEGATSAQHAVLMGLSETPSVWVSEARRLTNNHILKGKTDNKQKGILG